jgi:hypothetical protein
LIEVTVYTHYGESLVRVGRVKFIPAPTSPAVQVVLDPPGCVPDGVAILIKSQLLAGVNAGNVDWWYWQKD